MNSPFLLCWEMEVMEETIMELGGLVKRVSRAVEVFLNIFRC